MKNKISLIFCTVVLCCTPLILVGQTGHKITSPQQLYQEGRTLFQEKAYAAAIVPLQAFINQNKKEFTTPVFIGEQMEAEYMLACTAYELKENKSIDKLQEYLNRYPDTPHANRIYALMASVYFFENKYDEALAMFNSSQLTLLDNEERDDMTYRLATCYLKSGKIKDAAIWFETLKSTSNKYAEDCIYYLSYIRYTQQRYDEALKGFLSLHNNKKYQSLTPYYMAEINLIKKNYQQAEDIARGYLSAFPDNTHTAEMYRIVGETSYLQSKYDEARKAFEQYSRRTDQKELRRDALYMMGLSYYHCGVYSQATSTLEKVTKKNDALTQSAYLNMGLSYLQMSDKSNARMAFEQAAASNADLQVKEQAAYNYALCIYETSYSAFGESVNAFEQFLNEFPQSVYASKISRYLVDVYMNTRNYEVALNSIERITHPGNTILEAKQKILFQLGTQAFANSKFEKAIDYFNQTVTLGQYNLQTKADAFYWQGESYYRINKMQEASRSFNNYLNLTTQRNTETYALAYYNLGYISFHAKDYALAQDHFLKYIQLEKGENRTTLADAYNRIGDSFLHIRRFDEAKQYYSKAEGMGTPTGDYSFYQMALVNGLQKDYQNKIVLLNRLAEKYPTSPYVVNGLYEKGRSYVQRGNNQSAIQTFKELVNKYPESPVSRKAAAEIGLLYYQDNNYAAAIEAYKYVITKYPGSEEAHLAMRDLKSIYVDTNRVNEFATLVSQMPGNIQFEASEQDSLTYIAAEKIYMKGETIPAKASFTRYLQSFPNGAFSLNAHYYLCLIGQRQKDEETILTNAGKVLEYPDTPYSEEVLKLRAPILFNHAQYNAAMADYKQLEIKATNAENRQMGNLGILRCAVALKDDVATINASTTLLAEAKLAPELRNETLYDRAKAYFNQHEKEKAMNDLNVLAKDTRTKYGAEAKYLVANELYKEKKYAAAEKEILDFINQSTPHAYWLARSFVLLSDVYVAIDKKMDARQYLLSLQQNYHTNDDIQQMINTRLEKLK